MKTLIIIILTFFVLSVEAQKLQVTGLTNIDAQWNQLVKTNDSLKTILKSCQTDNYFLTQQYYKMAAQIKAQKKSIDSLQAIILNIKAKQFIDSIEFIGFNDTISGIFTKVTEKEYNIAPKFSNQILTRYPVRTPEGIKTKEITITELKR